MYIGKDKITNGYNEYIKLDSPEGRLAMMDVGLLVLEAGESYSFIEAGKEIAALLIKGEAEFKWEGKSEKGERTDEFDFNPYCLHTPAGVGIEITAEVHSEFYIQMSANTTAFEPKFYTPDNIHTQRAGANGEIGGKMRRNIRTVFDYSTAPYSTMVLGEVVNFPGTWSSYPPHWHPQPEVYFYRYDKPQGFGAGFTNGKVFETHHNGLLLITDDFHSQAAAPGYALYYVWGIRHLDGNPWKKTRIDLEEHLWMLEDNAEIWDEKV